MIRVSVVIPTYNRLQQLKRCLAGLEKQTYPPGDFEVVVISDGSTDGTDAYLLECSTPLNLKGLTQDNQGPAAARNEGIARASGEMILFIDDDIVPIPQLIEEHLAVHQERGSQAVVLGPMLTPPDNRLPPWVAWEQAMLEKQYADMVAGRWKPTARQFYTGNTSILREHLVDVGGFDTSFRRAEDVEMAYRLAERGMQFYFHPGAIGYHYAERSYKSWLTIPYDYGRNDVVFTQQKGQTWLLPTVIKEYHTRNTLVRCLVHACLDRPGLSAAAQVGLRQAAALAGFLGWSAVQRMAYSGIYNLRYYQGVADGLGGAGLFFEAIANNIKANNRQSGSS